MSQIMDVAQSFHLFWSLPVQVGVTLFLLYRLVEWAFLAGVTILVLFLPLNMVISKRIGELTQEMMLHKARGHCWAADVDFRLCVVRVCIVVVGYCVMTFVPPLLLAALHFANLCFFVLLHHIAKCLVVAAHCNDTVNGDNFHPAPPGRTCSALQ